MNLEVEFSEKYIYVIVKHSTMEMGLASEELGRA